LVFAVLIVGLATADAPLVEFAFATGFAVDVDVEVAVGAGVGVTMGGTTTGGTATMPRYAEDSIVVKRYMFHSLYSKRAPE
jgi:hypothetical protein